MSTFRHWTRLALNAEFTLLEERLASAKTEEKRDELRLAIAKNQENYPLLVDSAGLLRFVPEELHTWMALTCPHGELPKLTLQPPTAAHVVQFLTLLPPQTAGHSLVNHFVPIFETDPAVYRTFPYGFRISQSEKTVSCAVSWFFGESELRVLQVNLHLPQPWPARIMDEVTKSYNGLLLDDQVPYQKEICDEQRSMILRFPRAFSRDSGKYLTWRDVPILSEMSTCGSLDPCFEAKPPVPLKLKKPKKAAEVPPATVFRADIYVAMVSQPVSVRIGLYIFPISPTSREDLLGSKDFILWLQEQVKTSKIDPAHFIEVIVIIRHNGVCLKIDSGELEWTVS